MQTDNIFHKGNLANYQILITGGAGFIGSNLSKYFLEHSECKLRIMDNFSTGFHKNLADIIDHPRLEIMEADISDYNSCLKATKGVDFISHQAALGSVPRSIKFPLDTNKANVEGFLNIITAARENHVKRVVYASSSAVYGNSVELPKVESKIGQPLSPYAVTKYCNELYANVAWKVYSQQLIGLRYFNVFGPNQDPSGAYAAVIPLFMHALLKNEAPFINGSGKQSRDFTYVENAVQANVKAMFCENEAAYGENFNIALGERINLIELFDKIKELSGATVSAFHREDREGDIPHSLANISKARELLDYQPRVNVYEGLVKTINWFKQSYGL